MLSAQANHPSYRLFANAGFSGRFEVVEWFGDKAHVVISDVEGLAQRMEVVCMASAKKDQQAVSAAGDVRVTAVNYNKRTCNIEVSAHGDGANRIAMLWLLDYEPSALQRAPSALTSTHTPTRGATTTRQCQWDTRQWQWDTPRWQWDTPRWQWDTDHLFALAFI